VSLQNLKASRVAIHARLLSFFIAKKSISIEIYYTFKYFRTAR
jgi:hypothetical protein